MKELFGLVALQIVFAAILTGAVYMGQKADARYKPTPALKDCHPYPAAGPGAISCTWPESKPVNPWAPMRSCNE